MSAQSAGLGGGGMGVVHRAEDLKLSRRFTLKFLPDELSGGLRALGRLKQEARAAIPHSAFRTWLVPRGLTALYRWRPAGRPPVPLASRRPVPDWLRNAPFCVCLVFVGSFGAMRVWAGVESAHRC